MASNVTNMPENEIEQWVTTAQAYLRDRHPTLERVRELGAIFPAWVLANSTQMNRLHELGFTREDYHALRHKLANDERKLLH